MAFLPILAGGAPVPSSTSGGIGAFIQPYVDNSIIPGAVVLVATKDKILDLEAIGYADIGARKPMAINDVFAIASMSKPVAATAVMMLVDEGKLSVDDPVEKYLPEFKDQMYVAQQDANHILMKKPTHPVLIRDLLSHCQRTPLFLTSRTGRNSRSFARQLPARYPAACNGGAQLRHDAVDVRSGDQGIVFQRGNQYGGAHRRGGLGNAL